MRLLHNLVSALLASRVLSQEVIYPQMITVESSPNVTDLTLQDSPPADPLKTNDAGVVLGVIGLVFAVVGLIQTNIINFGPRDQHKYTSVRYWTGMALNNTNRLGDFYSGQRPTFVVYGHDGREMGKAHGWKKKKSVKQGDFDDVNVKHSQDGQSAYLKATFAQDWNPICISAIAVKRPDENLFLLSGDIGAACGFGWYHSVTEIDTKKYRPKCTWLGTYEGVGNNAMSFEIGGFGGTKERAAFIEKHRDVLCHSPARFAMYTNGSPDLAVPYFYPEMSYNSTTLVDIRDGRPDPRKDWASQGDPGVINPKHFESGPRKRANEVPKMPEVFVGHLIRSNVPKEVQSAKELCDSPSSMGPDFVSLTEKVFCDMSTRITWPLCTDDQEMRCFDVNTQEVRLDKSKRWALDTPQKRYTRIEDWN
ncbi:hypothetical protein BJ170DRAFT_262359 [Xylariales sp. AK1849]|nr:hypothetical protein BJ170DRAFT_262359 [Xylariales sp. AK1849]